MKPSPQQFEDLVSAYASGRIQPEQVEQLSEALRNDAEARDRFLSYLDLHATLSVAGSPATENPSVQAEPPLPRAEHRFASAGAPTARWVAAGVAACAALAVTLLLWVLSGSADSPETAAPGVREDEAVAVLTDAVGAVWANEGHAPRDVGEALGRVAVELTAGRAEFQFDSGAVVAIAGPAKLEFLGSDRARLHRGRMTAFVPEPARGFTVEFHDAKVVDLGTEFALNCDGESTAELHVFDGEVLVLPDERSEDSPLRLDAGGTKTVRTGLGRIEDARFDGARFLRVRRRPGRPTTTGDIRFLHRAPRSVLQGAFEHNEYILVFQERSDLTLNGIVRVNAVEPGNYRTKRRPEDPPGTAIAVREDRPDSGCLHPLAAGTRVDSYFVHFDPVQSGGRKGVHRRGAIRFARPVLGVIIATRHLVPTDAALGHPETRYETTDFAIARNGLEPDDRMALSQDRRTVRLKLGAGTSVDHVRILVEASARSGSSDEPGPDEAR